MRSTGGGHPGGFGAKRSPRQKLARVRRAVDVIKPASRYADAMLPLRGWRPSGNCAMLQTAHQGKGEDIVLQSVSAAPGSLSSGRSDSVRPHRPERRGRGEGEKLHRV